MADQKEKICWGEDDRATVGYDYKNPPKLTPEEKEEL